MAGWPQSRRRAVIDIGSNSVRLVIYDGPTRAPVPVFNEKSLCGLGDRDPETDELRPEAMEQALSILARFAAILKEADAKQLHVFATAASREAPNGPAFLEKIRALGFTPDVLTGEEEARYAALGILAGAPEVLQDEGGGLAGDMGGGSLELSRLDKDAPGHIAHAVSLPLGGLRLATRFEGRRAAAEQHVVEALGGVPWLAERGPTAFYVVGGAWRALGRLAIARAGHPIPILDHYQLPRGDAVALCRFVESQSAQSLASIPGVQRRRAPTLPFAAMVLRQILQISGVSRLSISSCGVREGVLFAGLDEAEQREDPLHLLCEDFAERLSPGGGERREALYRFLSPVFADETPRHARLRRAASILSGLAGLFHPDSRANEAAVSVLNMPFISLDHAGRIALAAILYQRHTAAPAEFPRHLHTELLEEEERDWARRVGLGLRFATDLDPMGDDALEAGSIALDGGALTLALPDDHAALLGEAPQRRFERFAQACGAEPKVKID